MKVGLDQHRQAHVDGRPFFLIGARHIPDGGSPELLRDAGFNAYRRVTFGTEGFSAEPAPPRDLEGIHFWSYLFDRCDFTRGPGHEAQLRRWIQEVRSHPALLCYENLNEPTLLYRGQTSFKSEPEVLARGTAVVRELDPDHPIWMAHCCHNTAETLARFNPCYDIVGCNPYPVYAPGTRRHIGMLADGRIVDCPDQSVHAVGKYTDKMFTVGAGRAVWMLIQGLANEHWFNPQHTPDMAGQTIDATKIIYPTFAQMRFMAYDAIVSGATGLAISMYKTPVGSPVWGDIARLVGELRSLHGALAAPPLPGAVNIVYSDLGFTIWDGVRVVARRLGPEVFVFATNTACDPAEVKIQLPVDSRGAATVVGEDREVVVAGTGGVIQDRFEGFAVHVYRLPAGR